MENQQESNPSWLAFIGICLVSFLGCIDFTIVNTALPAIQVNLGVSITQLQWVINIFMLTLSAFMIVAGRQCQSVLKNKLAFI